MGQAKLRKAEIAELKAKKSSIMLMPLSDDKLYKGKTHGEYIRANSIPNAIITGSVFNAELGMPIKVAVFVSTDVKDEQARGFGESWWTMPENKGPKFFVWLPLNDMKEMTASGLEKLGQGYQGKMLSNLLDLLGLSEMFKAGMKRMCEQDPSYIGMFNNIGHRFGDKIMETA
jgi:hypothetical protein